VSAITFSFLVFIETDDAAKKLRGGRERKALLSARNGGLRARNAFLRGRKRSLCWRNKDLRVRNHLFPVRKPVLRMRKRPLRTRIRALRAHKPRVLTSPAVRTIATTVVLLALSNVFMTFAWYAHLKNLAAKPWYVAALVSWGVALLEYLIQVPANRIGFTVLSLPQLKIVQEVVTLCVFIPFAVLYMRQPLGWNYLWAGLCMVGAVYFMFR
jgi:hypothetical protein